VIKYLGRQNLATLGLKSLKYAAARRPRIKGARQAAAEPLISVIIPTFNWSRVLRLAIHSVLWQQERNFELLVIGDGCTDDSESVVKSFGDARVQWHNLPVNSGHQSAPNNAGLAMARGKYIAILGHDDIWHPAHLRTLLRVIKDADIASSFTEMIGPAETNFRVLNGIYPEGGYCGSEILVPSGLLMRRATAERIGGWSDYRAISRNPDLDFVQRALEAGCKFASTTELTVFKFNSALRKTPTSRNLAMNRPPI